MNIVSLVERRNRELVEVLRELLQLAEEGRIFGHAFVIKMGQDDHRAGVSGDYKRHPTEAMAATFMMERKLAGDLPPLSFGDSRM